MIDPAMVRPGRVDKLLYVDLPSPKERLGILMTHIRRTPVDGALHAEIGEIVMSDKCEGFSGADIAALVRESATLALSSALEMLGTMETDAVDSVKDISSMRVTTAHFLEAAKKTLPSVSKDQRIKYERMRARFAGVPTKGKRMRNAEDGDGEGQLDS